MRASVMSFCGGSRCTTAATWASASQHMSTVGSEVVAALTPVVDAFTSLGIAYRIGGSVASSALGVPRSTLDADVVCDITEPLVDELVTKLEHDYYVDAEMIRDAIRRRSSFNVIHLSTMMKVDVFVKKGDAFSRESFERVVRKPLDVAADAIAFDLTTPEDIILRKLEWFELGQRMSERQWKDVVGVLAVQKGALDDVYLDRWAKELGVEDLLERARKEAASM